MLIDPGLIHTIRSLHREHRGLQKVVGDFTRKISADERWTAAAEVMERGEKIAFSKFPKVEPRHVEAVKLTRVRYYDCREAIEKERRACQRELLKEVKKLPAAAWIDTIPGIGLPSLAAIVGEAGDLNNYQVIAQVYKRFGLHVIDHVAARRIRGDASQGYVPTRRAEMHVIGTNILRSEGVYRTVYDERKALERGKAIDAGLLILPQIKINDSNRDCSISEGHIHNRAMRYAEKIFLKDLFAFWTGR